MIPVFLLSCSFRSDVVQCLFVAANGPVLNYLKPVGLYTSLIFVELGRGIAPLDPTGVWQLVIAGLLVERHVTGACLSETSVYSRLLIVTTLLSDLSRSCSVTSTALLSCDWLNVRSRFYLSGLEDIVRSFKLTYKSVWLVLILWVNFENLPWTFWL